MKFSTFAASTLAILALGFADLQTHMLFAQTTPTGDWLDTTKPNWNQPGEEVPRSPAPTTLPAQSTHNWWTGAKSPNGPSILTSSQEEKQYFERCKSLVRPGTLAEDALVEDAGWVLFDQAHIFGEITVVMAMAAVDGMCRPNQYQAFVFSDGQFAGSLSPTLMDARTDGAIDTIEFAQAPSTTKKDSTSGMMVPYASFMRYQASDALCCPSAASDVIYALTIEEGKPVVVPQLPAQTIKTCSD